MAEPDDHRILLVDDEAGIRTVLGIALTDSGYAVTTAENGEDALAKFRQLRPPIVLTDIKMPDMDGIELLQQIKAESADTEVIMFTGHGDMELAIKSLKYDATDFVTKPINDEVLEIALKRARERIVMRHQIRAYTHNLERLVDEKARQLIEAERMAAVGQTVAELSHTIKNIANALKGSIFVLGKGIELDEKEYLLQGWRMVEENVEKIKNLSLDLLHYGKYSRANFRQSPPNSPAEEVLRLMAAKASEGGVQLRSETPSMPFAATWPSIGPNRWFYAPAAPRMAGSSITWSTTAAAWTKAFNSGCSRDFSAPRVRTERASA
jgi:FixJ family two-component response regulator